MCPATTWESVLIYNLCIPIALALRRPSNTASYSAILLVHWNSSLTAYLILILDGEVIIAIVLAPMNPQSPSQYMIHSGNCFSCSGMVDGVQSAMKSANTCDLIAVLFSYLM